MARSRPVKCGWAASGLRERPDGVTFDADVGMGDHPQGETPLGGVSG
jgi:hypothetical protein